MHTKFFSLLFGSLLSIGSVFAQAGAVPTNSISTENIRFSALPGQVSVSGLEAPFVHVSVYNEKWLLVSGQWVTTQNLFVPDLVPGNYFVRAEFFGAERAASLGKKEAFVFVPDAENPLFPDNVSVGGLGDRIEIGGLPAGQACVSVYNDKWLLLDRHFAAQPDAAVSDLADGEYFVRVEFFSPDRSAVLGQKDVSVRVRAGSEVSTTDKI